MNPPRRIAMLFSDQSRLLALIIGCAVLWTVESWLPLYRYEPRRWRRALPNVFLTSLSHVYSDGGLHSASIRFGRIR